MFPHFKQYYVILNTNLVIGIVDLVLLAGALVRSGHAQDTVSINVKGDLNLGNTSWCWRDPGQVELAKGVVVLGHGPFALVHLDGEGGLVVRAVGGEGGQDSSN